MTRDILSSWGPQMLHIPSPNTTTAVLKLTNLKDPLHQRLAFHPSSPKAFSQKGATPNPANGTNNVTAASDAEKIPKSWAPNALANITWDKNAKPAPSRELIHKKENALIDLELAIQNYKPAQKRNFWLISTNQYPHKIYTPKNREALNLRKHYNHASI